MKKVVIKRRKQIAIVEVDTPKAVGDWALVRIDAAPMCTEYKNYRDGIPSSFLGHEAAGEVVEIDRAGDVRAGDRVVVMPQYPCGQCSLCRDGEYIHCQNTYDFEDFTGSPEGQATYAQYMLKPSWLLPRIPAGMSTDHASMLCCGLGPTFGAMERMQTGPGDTVLITGMGPVGLGGIINGVARDARIIAVSRHEYRSDLAKSLGAESVVDPEDEPAADHILQLTQGLGVDMAIDCAGSPEAQKLCIAATKRNGRIGFVGESGSLKIGVSKDLIRNGLTLYGVWHYNLVDVPKLFQIVKKHNDLTRKLITHTFPLSQAREAFELQLARKCGKVILHPWE